MYFQCYVVCGYCKNIYITSACNDSTWKRRQQVSDCNVYAIVIIALHTFRVLGMGYQLLRMLVPYCLILVHFQAQWCTSEQIGVPTNDHSLLARKLSVCQNNF